MIKATITKQVDYTNDLGRIRALQPDESVLITRVPQGTVVVNDTKTVTTKDSYWAILEDTVVMLPYGSFKTVD